MAPKENPAPAGAERFVLRRAAGSAWLVDVLQDSETYRPPLQLNETGALLWEGFCRGEPEEALARQLSGEEVPPREALEDVRAFLAQLRALTGTRP